jgi:uncharacterized protein YuzE
VKIFYDDEVDAAYIELSTQHPQGVIELAEGVNLDVTEDHHIVSIEILDASKKLPIETLYRLEIDRPMAHAA